MKIGDLVEVRFTKLSGIQSSEFWKAALVVAIHEDHGSFDVKALKGAFDGEGHEYMALHFWDRHRGWR